MSDSFLLRDVGNTIFLEKYWLKKNFFNTKKLLSFTLKYIKRYNDPFVKTIFCFYRNICEISLQIISYNYKKFCIIEIKLSYCCKILQVAI